MDVFQNMELFSELIQCGGNIYTWCYNADGSLLQSNCPEAGFLSGAFEIFGCKKKMLDYGSRHTTPVTLGTAIGMTWAAAFEKDGSVLKRAWVIGPVFYQDVSLRGIEQGLQYYNRLETSVAWTMQLYEALKTVPVLQCTVLHRYALMMHYCLTGNHLAISDINSEFLAQVRNAVQQPAHDRHKVWMAEQGLLQMVRTGDLNYRQALSASMGISAGVPVRSDDALRQSKTSIIVFTSLVCRAAIEGGLSPEEAYALGDSYIQSAENAKTLEVHAHLHAAFGGFACIGSSLGGLLCHQAEPLGDSRQLQTHIRLIDGADDVKLTAQLLHHIADIALEIFDRAFSLPAALGNQPFGAGEMQQRHNGFHTVRLAAGNDLAVMLDLGRVKLALLRLDARPLDGEAVGVQARIGQQFNVLLILIIMVAGNAARLGKAGVGQLLLRPVVGMDIVTLDLMGGSSRADKETFFKFLHNFLLTCAV